MYESFLTPVRNLTAAVGSFLCPLCTGTCLLSWSCSLKYCLIKLSLYQVRLIGQGITVKTETQLAKVVMVVVMLNLMYASTYIWTCVCATEIQCLTEVSTFVTILLTFQHNFEIGNIDGASIGPRSRSMWKKAKSIGHKWTQTHFTYFGCAGKAWQHLKHKILFFVITYKVVIVTRDSEPIVTSILLTMSSLVNRRLNCGSSSWPSNHQSRSPLVSATITRFLPVCATKGRCDKSDKREVQSGKCLRRAPFYMNPH